MAGPILLVDDDIAEIAAVKRVLQRAGHRVVLATNASDALSAVGSVAPEVAIVAVECDGGGGEEVARRLAAKDGRGVVVLLVGAPLEGVAARALARPVDAGSLTEEVARALAEAAAAPARAAAATPRAAGASLLDLAPASAGVEDAALREAEEALRARAKEMEGEGEGGGGDGGEGPHPGPLPAGPGEGDPLPTSENAGAGLGSTASATASTTASPTTITTASTIPTSTLTTITTASTIPTSTPTSNPTTSPTPTFGFDGRPDAEPSRPRPWPPEGGQGSSPSPSPAPAPIPSPSPSLIRSPSPNPSSTAFAPPAPTPAPPPALPAALLSGDGEGVSPARLLALAAASGATGRLDVLLQPARALWIENGRIVGAASDAPGERPLDVGRKLGLLTVAQHDAMEPSVAGMGSRRVGVLLLEQGFLDASELAVLARARALEVVGAVLAAPAAHRFTPGAAVPASERVVTPGSALGVAVDVLRRTLAAERVDALLGGPDTLLAPADGAPELDAAGLPARDALLASGADGLRTVEEVAAGVADDDARPLLAALVEVGLLEVRHRAAPVGGRATAFAADLDRVAEKLREVRHGDYFTVLGLAPGATARAASEAADRIAAAMDPSRFPDALPGLAADLAEIGEVVAEARAVLCDGDLGPAYGRALAGARTGVRSGVANAASEW